MKIKSVTIYKRPEAGLLRVYYKMTDDFVEIGRVQNHCQIISFSDGDFTL